MLDAETIRRVESARETAVHDGFDLIELLDRHGLILTSERRAAITVDTLAWMISLIEEQPVTAFTHLAQDASPAGAVRGVVSMIRMAMRA